MSMGMPMLTVGCVGGTIESFSGNGHIGVVSFGVMRVSASMPRVIMIVVALTLGCTATARVGRNSSHSGGAEALPAVSGIERQALLHWMRALRSNEGSLRIRLPAASIWSATFLSITGLICAGTLTRAPATARLVS